MLTSLVLGLAMGTAMGTAAPTKQPPQQWQLEITMTMAGQSRVAYNPPVSRERCEAQRVDLLANKAGMEKAGGVKIAARCVPAG